MVKKLSKLKATILLKFTEKVFGKKYMGALALVLLFLGIIVEAPGVSPEILG